MSIHEKSVRRLLSLPKNFTYEEIVNLLNGFGYNEIPKGKSSGSAVMFYNRSNKNKIMFHKPHPGNEMKKYVLKLIIERLKKTNQL